jgi:hypothetical protein
VVEWGVAWGSDDRGGPGGRNVSPWDVLQFLLELDRRLLGHPGCLATLVCGTLAVISESVGSVVGFPYVVCVVPSVSLAVVTSGCVVLHDRGPVGGLRRALGWTAVLASVTGVLMSALWLWGLNEHALGTVCCMLGLGVGAVYERRALA